MVALLGLKMGADSNKTSIYHQTQWDLDKTAEKGTSGALKSCQKDYCSHQSVNKQHNMHTCQIQNHVKVNYPQTV
jgi:hypothetical protein